MVMESLGVLEDPLNQTPKDSGRRLAMVTETLLTFLCLKPHQNIQNTSSNHLLFSCSRFATLSDPEFLLSPFKNTSMFPS